jgi:hypothetical protein
MSVTKGSTHAAARPDLLQSAGLLPGYSALSGDCDCPSINRHDNGTEPS